MKEGREQQCCEKEQDIFRFACGSTKSQIMYLLIEFHIVVEVLLAGYTHRICNNNLLQRQTMLSKIKQSHAQIHVIQYLKLSMAHQRRIQNLRLTIEVTWQPQLGRVRHHGNQAWPARDYVRTSVRPSMQHAVVSGCLLQCARESMTQRSRD